MNFFRSTFIVSFYTLVSRMLGYIRDMVIAAELGTGILNDAFIAAFKLANLFRAIFAEGGLSSAFVPIFTKILVHDGEDKAKRFLECVNFYLAIILVFFTIIIIWIMPIIIEVTTPGFKEHKEIFELTVALARITFPYLLFISLAALYGSALNSIDKFFAFAFTPIILNIVMIMGVLYMPAQNKGYSLSYSVLVAGILELLWMLYFLKNNNFLPQIMIPEFSKEVKLLIKRMIPGVISSGVMQINIWINMIFVSFIEGGMSYLYFAERVMQFPLAIIATTIATVLLPTLSKQLRSNLKLAFETQNATIRMVLFFAIPSTFGLVYFSEHIIKLLFEYGAFTHQSTLNTSYALMAFSSGLVAFSLVKIFTMNFHAHGDTKTPVKVAIVSIVFNCLLSIPFMQKFGYVGIALASSFAGWLNCILLFYLLVKSSRYLPSKLNLYNSIIYIISSMFMLVVIALFEDYLLHLHWHHAFILKLTIGFLSYVLFCFACGIRKKNFSTAHFTKEVSE